jgi:hypothetical protein
MATPFSISKLPGREDRYSFGDKPIDDYLDIQTLRNIYFQLSGESFKVGQLSCKKFPRKGDLILESHRLIKLYTLNPKSWTDIIVAQEKKIIAREKAAVKRAEKAVVLQARIDSKVAELTLLSNEEFEILQKAMAISVRISSEHSSSDSE